MATGTTEQPLHWRRHRRFLPARVDQALNSVLSTGPGYEPTPLGVHLDTTTVRGYYLDFRSKTTSESASDVASLPNTNVIQLALGWWERHLDGEPDALGRFLALVDEVAERAERTPRGPAWPTHVPVSKYGMLPPWQSALPQAQAASVFVRAHLASGRDDHAALAVAALWPFTDPGHTVLVTHTSDGPVLQEVPSTPPSHILNGWVSALWGVWDVHQGLGDSAAGTLLTDSVECLRRFVPAYDTGWWTLYSLYPHPLEDLAKPIYHRLHITQMQSLHKLGGFPEFDEAAKRWTAYLRPANVALAVMHKGVFTMADGRRRRRWERTESPR